MDLKILQAIANKPIVMAQDASVKAISFQPFASAA